MRLRNINPVGDVYATALGRTLERGEVFEVTDAEAALLLPQTANFERADGKPLSKPHPRGVPGSWPTPVWWQAAPGWCLLALRCERCHRIAARFIVPAARSHHSLPAFTVSEALAKGGWVSSRPDARRREDPRNRVSGACECEWGHWPTPTEPAMRTALLKSLRGPRPEVSLNVATRRPQQWARAGFGAKATVLSARPSTDTQK